MDDPSSLITGMFALIIISSLFMGATNLFESYTIENTVTDKWTTTGGGFLTGSHTEYRIKLNGNEVMYASDSEYRQYEIGDNYITHQSRLKEKLGILDFFPLITVCVFIGIIFYVMHRFESRKKNSGERGV